MLLVLKSKKKNFPRMMNFLKKLEKRLKNKGCQMDFSSFEDIEVFLEKGQ